MKKNTKYEVEYYAYVGEHGHVGSYLDYATAYKEAMDLYKREEKNADGSLKELSYIGINGDGDEFAIIYMSQDYLRNATGSDFKDEFAYESWVDVAKEVLKTGKPQKGNYSHFVTNKMAAGGSIGRQYYVAWSSWFGTHPYDVSKIKSIVESAGGKNAHAENQFGWSNQPDVVVFNAKEENIESIKQALQKGIGTEWIIISEKDWRMKKMATGGKITVSNEGNWVDGNRGIYQGQRIIEIAEGYGFVVKPEDIVNKTPDGEFYSELVDDATDYLNELAPEGYYFGNTENGDFGMWKTDDEYAQGGKMGIGGFVLGAAAGFVAGKKLDLGWNPKKVKFASGGEVLSKYNLILCAQS